MEHKLFRSAGQSHLRQASMVLDNLSNKCFLNPVPRAPIHTQHIQDTLHNILSRSLLSQKYPLSVLPEKPLHFVKPMPGHIIKK